MKEFLSPVGFEEDRAKLVSRGISILSDIQSTTGQNPKQPNLNLKAHCSEQGIG